MVRKIAHETKNPQSKRRYSELMGTILFANKFIETNATIYAATTNDGMLRSNSLVSVARSLILDFIVFSLVFLFNEEDLEAELLAELM
jgi:hypothetical protein